MIFKRTCIRCKVRFHVFCTTKKVIIIIIILPIHLLLLMMNSILFVFLSLVVIVVFFLNENFDFSLHYIHIRHNPLPTTTDNVKLIRNNYPYLSLKHKKKCFIDKTLHLCLLIFHSDGSLNTAVEKLRVNKYPRGTSSCYLLELICVKVILK